MNQKAAYWTIGILSFIAGLVVAVVLFFALIIYVSFIREKDDAPAEEEVVYTPQNIDGDEKEISDSAQCAPWCSEFGFGRLS